MRTRSIVLCLFALFPLLADSAWAQAPIVPGAPAARAAPPPVLFRQLPASFSGDLPCADCQGIRYRLNLFEQGAFYLGMTYLGNGDARSQDDIGTWMVSSNGRVLVLSGGREAPTRFRIVDETTLRKLDLEGRDITSSLNYAIRRTAAFERIEPRLAMRGMFSYMADAGTFAECSTGQRWPVAQEGGNTALQREYAKARTAPGAPVMISLEGRVAMQPGMEGPGLQPALVPDRFIAAFPGGTCGPRPGGAPLEGPWWALTRLGDTPVLRKDPKREPGLVFDAASGRASGSGACNRIAGAYRRAGIDGLTFGQFAGTTMVCVDGMDMEAAFLKALGRVTAYNVLGSMLEFFDDAGGLVARFEARAQAPAK